MKTLDRDQSNKPAGACNSDSEICVRNSPSKERVSKGGACGCRWCVSSCWLKRETGDGEVVLRGG